MSRRVLGQYDPLVQGTSVQGTSVPGNGGSEGDTIFFVGPNIAAIEARYGFSPRPFRLWLAIHEVTHRCQFTAVPWMRDHFVSLVEKAVEPLAADPKRLAEALARVISELRAGKNPLEGSGIMGLIATPEQREALGHIQGLMSLLEGHGDVVMDRAGGEAVPGAARFSKVLHDRRTRWVERRNSCVRLSGSRRRCANTPKVSVLFAPRRRPAGRRFSIRSGGVRRGCRARRRFGIRRLGWTGFESAPQSYEPQSYEPQSYEPWSGEPSQ